MNRLNEAIIFATHAHENQVRKVTKTPYILHPLEVCNLIATIKQDEDLMIAGVLHDVCEDCGVSIDVIKEKFGSRVSELVNAETENKFIKQSKEETWMIRKQESINRLKKTTDEDIRILWMCDKVSNLRSLRVSYQVYHEDLWNFFHQKDKKMHKWYYTEILNELDSFKDTLVYKEYLAIMNELFGGIND